jgi:hypothetical protein
MASTTRAASNNNAKGGVLKMDGPVLAAVIVINKENPENMFLGACGIRGIRSIHTPLSQR